MQETPKENTIDIFCYWMHHTNLVVRVDAEVDEQGIRQVPHTMDSILSIPQSIETTNLVVLVDAEIDEQVALGGGHVDHHKGVLVGRQADRLHRRNLDRLRGGVKGAVNGISLGAP